jgi:hypothetical protein
MADPPSPKISPRTQYFLAVVVVMFAGCFVLGRIDGGYSRFHPGVPLERLSLGKSVLASLAFAFVVAFFTAKKKFG